LTYAQKQVKCLSWLLEREGSIGAFEAEDYFINILPLEIRILERRHEAGESVVGELEKMRRILKNKLVGQIPSGILPDK